MQKEDENVEIQVWNNSEHCNIFAKLVIMNKKPSINSDLKGVSMAFLLLKQRLHNFNYRYLTYFHIPYIVQLLV